VFLTVRQCQKIRSLNTSGQAFWKNRIFNRASVPKNPIFWKNRIFNRASVPKNPIFWKNRIFNCASKNPESDSEKLVVPEGTSVPTEEGS
jgi:hypothetical protein